MKKKESFPIVRCPHRTIILGLPCRKLLRAPNNKPRNSLTN